MANQARFRFLTLGLAALAILVFALWIFDGPPFSKSSSAIAAEPPPSKEQCIACHGPYDALAKNTEGYIAQSGEKETPHRFTPHNKSDASAIPNCTNCHQAHALPPVAAAIAAQPKPEVQWCYAACHHENNFKPCTECHK